MEVSGQNLANEEPNDSELIIKFRSPDGEFSGPELAVPFCITKAQLNALLNDLLQNDEKRPYSFSLPQDGTTPDIELLESLSASFSTIKGHYSAEKVHTINYVPLAVFRVNPITHTQATLEGHTEAVLCVAFSPDGQVLASGSGDTTVRLWDIWTQTPLKTLKGHSNWVLCVSWSPDSSRLASGGMDKSVLVWSSSGELLARLLGHGNAVTYLTWQPVHLISSANQNKPLLASGSKDCTIKIWDTVASGMLLSLSSHTKMITSLRWSGSNFLFSACRDCTVKVWNVANGQLLKDLKGHGHWVNHLALNSEQVLRNGGYDHKHLKFENVEEMKTVAKQRYDKFIKDVGGEKLLSCSDDMTMFLWNVNDLSKSLGRMTGHQQAINHICFSPDGRYFASASFDKSIRVWNGSTGKYIATLRGHVGKVFQICWSADSRYLLSGSSDSTLKVWDIANRKLKEDLPGHADEVYAVDWSSSSNVAASGSKDRIVKIWK